jgi:hypothetical protein
MMSSNFTALDTMLLAKKSYSVRRLKQQPLDVYESA